MGELDDPLPMEDDTYYDFLNLPNNLISPTSHNAQPSNQNNITSSVHSTMPDLIMKNDSNGWRSLEEPFGMPANDTNLNNLQSGNLFQNKLLHVSSSSPPVLNQQIVPQSVSTSLSDQSTQLAQQQSRPNILKTKPSSPAIQTQPQPPQQPQQPHILSKNILPQVQQPTVTSTSGTSATAVVFHPGGLVLQPQSINTTNNNAAFCNVQQSVGAINQKQIPQTIKGVVSPQQITLQKKTNKASKSGMVTVQSMGQIHVPADQMKQVSWFPKIIH